MKSLPVPPRFSTARRPANRRERHRTETRARLYRAALDLFAERGFMETTVEDITEAADVGKGTFFNYFPTKEHVLAAYGAERVARVEQALEEAKESTRPVHEVIRDLAADSAGQSKEHPALLRAIYAAHASCAPVRVELQKRMRVARRALARLLALAQERGEMRRDVSTSDLAHIVQIALMGTCMVWALQPDASLRKTSLDLWDLMWPSLAQPAAASRPEKLRA
ncbi:MAG TPA: TetR family transcriptional regulator [Candidatus Acidoferrum sp.]|nr:TetR family transcriptional regulator [Candidatus Acidoferrum sp.]